jgi:hypothetical protein
MAELTLSEAAKKFNVSTKTISRWSKSGKLNVTKTPSGRNLYSAQTVVIDGVPLTPDTPEINAINQVLKKLPPSGGDWTLPAVQQYVGIIQAVSKFYKNPDQAIQNSWVNARRMFYNLFIRDPLQARMLATAELPWEIQPEDKKDKRQVEVANGIQRIIEEIPDFLKYRHSLLNAIWFGKWAVQSRYEWSYRTGRRALKVKDWSPVHGDTLIPKWDTNDWGIYTGIYSGWDGTKDVTTEPGFISRAHVLTDSREPKRLSLSERQAFVIHAHDYVPGDFLDAQAAGGIRGLGIRSVVYWTYLCLSEITGWLVEYLERVGTGVTFYKFLRGNEQSYLAAKQLAESQSNQAAVFVPVDPDIKGGEPLEYIERMEPSGQPIDNMMKVIELFGSQIRRYIQGQDATSQPVGEGLGTGVSEAHENTFNRIVRYDAQNLADTLTRDLVEVIQQWTYPEADFRCKFVINVDRPDPKETLEGVYKAYQMGVTFDEDEVRALTGLSKPDLDAVILGQNQGQAEQPQEQPADDSTNVVTEEVPEGGEPTDQAESLQDGNDLRSTVGGLQAIAALQASYYEGKIPQIAAINNVVLLFGFTPEEAESLFPAIPPEKLTQDQGPGLEGGEGEQPAPFRDDDDQEAISFEDDPALDCFDAQELELLRFAGFTGEKPDKLGRRTCWNGGKRIKCPPLPPGGSPGPGGKGSPPAPSGGKGAPPAPGPTGKKPAKPTVADLHNEIQTKLASGKVTAADVKDLTSKLTQLTVKEISEIKTKLNLKASGSKAELAKKVAERALAAVKPTTKPKFPPDAQVRTFKPASKAMEQSTMNLSLDAQEGVYAYTDKKRAAIVNKDLREGKKPADQQMMDDLEKAFTETKAFTSPRVVYRGIQVDTNKVKAFINEDAESQASCRRRPSRQRALNPEVATNFGQQGVMFEITAKKGIYCEPVSQAKGEEEVLLNKDSTFRFVGAKQLKYKVNGKDVVP